MSSSLDDSYPSFLLDYYSAPPVMSVKQHLDESRDPSISSFSDSHDSDASSIASTPDSLDARSSVGASPATPLIFRSHFVGSQACDVLHCCDSDSDSGSSLAKGHQELNELGKQSQDSGSGLPAAVALADNYRLREEQRASLPTMELSPADEESRKTLLPSSADVNGRGGNDGPTLVSPAPISIAPRLVCLQGPWWTLNEQWSIWPYQEDGRVETRAESHQEDTISHPSPKTVSPATFEHSTADWPHVDEAGNRAVMSEDALTTSPTRTDPATSTATSPASIVVAAQRRAWLEHFYPDGDVSQRPHLIQLAKLRIPSADEVQARADSLSSRQEPPELQPPNHSELGLGSPFQLAEEPSKLAGELEQESSKDDLPCDSKDGQSLSADGEGHQQSVSRKASTDKGLRHRALSMTMVRPTTRQPSVTTRQALGNGRPRTTSVYTRRPSSSTGLVEWPPSPERPDACASITEAVKSLLYEQVLTPTEPYASKSIFRETAQDRATPATTAPVPIFGRPRAHTVVERITFAEAPTRPKRASTLCGSSTGTGHAPEAKAGLWLSRLIQSRGAREDDAISAPGPVKEETVAADNIATTVKDGQDTSGGMHTARSSPSASASSPSSPSDSDSRRAFSPSHSTLATDAVTSIDAADASTLCSTAPSTPKMADRATLSKCWACSSPIVSPTISPSTSTSSRFDTYYSPLKESKLGSPIVFGKVAGAKPLPLPRVELDAVLRLRPSLGELCPAAGSPSPQTTIRRRCPTASADLRGARDRPDHKNSLYSTASSSSDAMAMHFRELKASWEARARQASRRPSTTGSRLASALPCIDLSVEAQVTESSRPLIS